MLASSRNIALIVAAGQGNRAGGELPKQYQIIRGLPVLRHSVLAFSQHKSIDAIYIAIGDGQNEMAAAAIADFDKAILIEGGATRQASVSAGLTAIAKDGGAKTVLIHDAARPFLPQNIIDNLLIELQNSHGAVPGLPVIDSLAIGGDMLEQPISRDRLWRIQTPQAFHFDRIYDAHLAWDKQVSATDDAQILKAFGDNVAIIQGDERLSKITFAEDFTEVDTAKNSFRVGNGFDVHRLVSGDGIWLCGVFLPYHQKLAGHSDADVALHAITDAILGAMAMGDIGDHFPPSDPQWKGASSDQFLRYACELAQKAGYHVGNVDVTIICEAPKIGPHRLAMRSRIAEIMFVDVSTISVKATTTELLGFTGRGEGIAAQASVCCISNERGMK
jgi:2-C-methyl-D-erythritol 4-phosphate cytidylyltransferase / 2-C-methyl-D-erythritol 2,4-cyclodiphosphate synthase